MTLAIRRIDPAAQLPTYAHPGDSGMDVRSIETVTLRPGDRALVRTGLVFQLPLILFVLGWFGILTSKVLREKRRVAIVLSFFLAMFLTPPDPMSQIFMAVPLALLYELSIWAIWLKEKSSFK